MNGRVLVSVFKSEDDILQATRAARKEGLEIVDVFTPYAVHGMDRAMGLPSVADSLGVLSSRPLRRA